MITRKNKKQRTASTRQTLAPTEEHVDDAVVVHGLLLVVEV